MIAESVAAPPNCGSACRWLDGINTVRGATGNCRCSLSPAIAAGEQGVVNDNLMTGVLLRERGEGANLYGSDFDASADARRSPR